MNHDALLETYRQRIIDEDLGDWALVSLIKREKGETITRHAARKIIKASKGVSAEDPVSRSWDEPYEFNPVTGRYLTRVPSAPGGVIVTTEPEHKAIKSAYSNWDGASATLNQIAARFHFPRRYLIQYLRAHGITHDCEPFTREEVLKRDTDEMAEEVYQGLRHKLQQVSERKRWKRISEAAKNWFHIEDSLLTLVDAVELSGASEVSRLLLPEADRPFALYISWQDLHLGMYSQDYNRGVAVARLQAAVGDILSRLPGRPEVIHTTAGGDLTHTDGTRHTTTKGTELDTDGNPEEHLTEACTLSVDMIDTLRQIAPVVVHPVRGNHGRANDLAIQLFLWAWYREVDGVDVVRSLADRVYLEYGETLIGVCHGDDVKEKDLGPIMAAEAREAWGRTRHHVWMTGHLHHLHMREIGGVLIVQDRALCGTDRWHHKKGFVTSQTGMSAHMIDHTDGLIASLRSLGAT